ncbi:MAG: DUF2384 domain-containing protein [Rhodothermales bacterium]
MAESYNYLDWDLPTAARKVAEGLPTYALERVRERLSVSRKEFSDIIQISERTLSRRAKERALPVDESERVYRLSRLMELAARVLGSEDDARDWMKESNFALGGAIPLEYVRTEPGAELVEQILGRIEHGIPV